MTDPQVIRGECVAVPTDLLRRLLKRVVTHQGAMIIGDPVPANEVVLLGNECRALERYALREVIILAPADWRETPDVKRARRRALKAESEALARQLSDPGEPTTHKQRRQR